MDDERFPSLMISSSAGNVQLSLLLNNSVLSFSLNLLSFREEKEAYHFLLPLSLPVL